MTITAKYAARCSACNCAINPGQKIEWTKGQPVRHTSCGSTTTAAAPVSAPRKARRPGTWTGCSCGSRVDSSGTLIAARNNCEQCEFDA